MELEVKCWFPVDFEFKAIYKCNSGSVKLLQIDKN
jgi:hypothetical protein